MIKVCIYDFDTDKEAFMTLKEFENAYNFDEINQTNTHIKFIETSEGEEVL